MVFEDSDDQSCGGVVRGVVQDENLPLVYIYHLHFFEHRRGYGSKMLDERGGQAHLFFNFDQFDVKNKSLPGQGMISIQGNRIVTHFRNDNHHVRAAGIAQIQL
jgi:hypothetical protein